MIQIPLARALPNPHTEKPTLESIHPYEVTLNIDEINFKDREKVIDDWATTMCITGSTLDMSNEGFVKFLKMSLAGVAKTA